MENEQIQPTVKKLNYDKAHGRRKVAIARVRLYKGRGETLVNDKKIEEYFPGAVAQALLKRPFSVTKSEGVYWATVKVVGSGKNSQLGAVIHGLSRALTVANPELRTNLKTAGLLTRDPRAKERRKFGRAQKARKGKQSPKR